MVAEARQAVIDAFQTFGAVHFQIGRTYPWLNSLHPAARSLIFALKRELDPDNRMNPGALGL